jgi:hypothetical protein
MQKLPIKEEIMAVAALLALGTLAIMTSMIASYALMKPAVQHYNVGTQVSVGYCGYKSGWFSDGGKFADCMVDLWIPKIPAGIGAAVGTGAGLVQIGKTVGSWALIRAGVRIAGFAGIWGWGIAAL